MSNYFVLVYRGPTTKQMSVNLIIAGFFCVVNLSIKCIAYVNTSVVYFNFSRIIGEISKLLNCCTSVTSSLIEFNINVTFKNDTISLLFLIKTQHWSKLWHRRLY